MTIATIKIIFWICLALVVYTYVGYGIVLFFLVRIKRLFTGVPNPPAPTDEEWPEVTFIVPAYNEERWIIDKIENSLAFDYPKDRIHFFFVTDGSKDGTTDAIRNYPFPTGVSHQLFHDDARRGKIAAVERIMPFVKTPVTIYTDANTVVNKLAVKNIARHYLDPKVGAVAGEKRIQLQEKGAANDAGEGIYWKYESTLKKWDSELYSVVGAAGELFSIRTELFEAVPQDTIIEDFCMTLGIAQKGYKVVYEPQAIAAEGPSASVKEELKRKIRIAAGGLQAVSRMTPLLNVFKYGVLTFQYISHRVLRWTLTPMALPIVFITNVILALKGLPFFQIMLACQTIFYLLALGGFILEKRKIKFKAFFVPYYFCIMNYAVYRGFFRFIGGRQAVTWEKAKRA